MSPTQLPYKEGLDLSDRDARVLYFDIEPVFERIQHLIKPKSRIQKDFNMKLLFPQDNPKLCACGCGEELTGRRTRWATMQCAWVAHCIYSILYGSTETIKTFLSRYGGHGCFECGEAGYHMALDVDHILPVHLGGGGLWLNNYQLLCKPCHKAKSKKEAGKRARNRDNLQIEF